MKKYKKGYTTGVFDLFHIGHLNILKKAKEQCDYLIVGVSDDNLVMREKQKYPIIPLADRIEIVKSIKFVDEVVIQYDKNKLEAWKKYRFNAMFVGSDWKDSQQWRDYELEFSRIGVDIIYFPHTDGISSTIIRSKLIDQL